MADNDLCVYCSKAPADTADHVFARSFFPESNRHGLPKVPACKKCNGHKSKLENYLVNVLPLGSDHPAAQHRITTKWQRSISINFALWYELRSGQNIVWEKTRAGVWIPTTGLPLRSEVSPTYFALVGRGLLYHHGNIRLSDDYCAVAIAMKEDDFERIKSVHNIDGNQLAFANIAEGACSYIGYQAVDQPQVSIWQIKLYGGINMRSGDRNQKQGDIFVVITASRELISQQMTEYAKYMR